VLSARDFVLVNLDLILYEDEHLLNNAFTLMIRFHQQRLSLYSLMKQVQILEDPEAISTMKQADEKLTELRKLAEKAEFWMGQKDDDSILKSINAVDILDYLQSLCVGETSNPFDEGQGGNVNQAGQDILEPEIEDIFGPKKDKEKKLTDKEKIENFKSTIELNERPICDEFEKPHKENQRMLHNLNAYYTVMSIINQNGIEFCHHKPAY
jgi:hypothetical protein